MEIVIYCEECTQQARAVQPNMGDWPIIKFESLTAANNHITQYGHVVKLGIGYSNPIEMLF